MQCSRNVTLLQVGVSNREYFSYHCRSDWSTPARQVFYIIRSCLYKNFTRPWKLWSFIWVECQTTYFYYQLRCQNKEHINDSVYIIKFKIKFILEHGKKPVLKFFNRFISYNSSSGGVSTTVRIIFGIREYLKVCFLFLKNIGIMLSNIMKNRKLVPTSQFFLLVGNDFSYRYLLP